MCLSRSLSFSFSVVPLLCILAEIWSATRYVTNFHNEQQNRIWQRLSNINNFGISLSLSHPSSYFTLVFIVCFNPCIVSPSSPARLKAVMACWGPALWSTNAECVAGRNRPAERWRGASEMSPFPSVTTRSWTSHLELHSSTLQREKPAQITLVRPATRKQIHAPAFQIGCSRSTGWRFELQI